MVILDDGSKSAGYIRGYTARQEEVDALTARVRELEAGLKLLADEDNWDYDGNTKYWFHRDADGQGTDAQEIARAALADEKTP